MVGKLIHVRFVDAKTGAVFAESHVPSDDLPKEFGLQTTLHIGGQEWQVRSAAPISADDFIASGSLILTLERVEKVDPKEILFSLPTIENELPRTSSLSSGTGTMVFRLNEDEWRQVEFVSRSLADAISSELRGIQGIFDNATVELSKGVRAFKEVHARKSVPSPIVTNLPYSELLAALPVNAICYSRCGFYDSGHIVAEGFAHGLPGAVLYGYKEAGRVKVLGLSLAAGVEGRSRECTTVVLQKLMETNELLLVDWCRVTCLEAEPASLSSFLNWFN